MAGKGFIRVLISALTAVLIAGSVGADCGHIVTWSEADKPAGSDWNFFNNKPTTMNSPGFPNLSTSAEGGPRTCFDATYTCAGVWLNFRIVSYATDAEARSVYDVFRSDPIIQEIADDDYGSLVSADSSHLAIMGGTYTSEYADYATMSLYAVYRGTLITVERTRGHLPPATPPIDDMTACLSTAYTYAKGLIDAKCGGALSNHSPEILLGSMEEPPFSGPLPPTGSTSSFWIALFDPDGIQDLDTGTFNVAAGGTDVTGTFISEFQKLYADAKAKIENLPNGLKVSFSRLSWVDVAEMLGMLTGTCAGPGGPCENRCSPMATFQIKDKSGAMGQVSSIFRVEEDGPHLFMGAASASLRCSDSDLACAIGQGGSGAISQVLLIVQSCTGWADLDWSTFRVSRNGGDITQQFLNQLVTLIASGKLALDVEDNYQINVVNREPLSPEDLRTLLHFFEYGVAGVEVSIADKQGGTSEVTGSWTFAP